jgi:hypothetical protein
MKRTFCLTKFLASVLPTKHRRDYSWHRMTLEYLYSSRSEKPLPGQLLFTGSLSNPQDLAVLCPTKIKLQTRTILTQR